MPTGALQRSKTWFDIAAIDTDELSPGDLEALRDKIRRIGIDRVVFASDWDEAQPATYLESLKGGLGLSDAEWNQLLENEAPFFQ